MDLQGHALIITGAGRGMGAAHARAAAAIGASVIVNDIDVEAAEMVAADIRATGGQAIAEGHNIADPRSAEAMVQHCISAFGAITGLVNNAAIQVDGPFEQSSLEELRRALEVNVVGLYNMVRAAIDPMLRQRRGSIVNITSGAQTGQNGLSLYGATKGAVASMTYALAGEYQDRGVRVNAVSPMASTRMSGHAATLPAPETNIGPVLYLLSDRSAPMTGQVVRITGRKLSLMSHPAIRAPILERDVWSADDVANAFDTTLADKLLPTNVAVYDIASVGLDTVAQANARSAS